MGSFKVFVGNLGAVASRAANDQSVITITEKATIKGLPLVESTF